METHCIWTVRAPMEEAGGRGWWKKGGLEMGRSLCEIKRNK